MVADLYRRGVLCYCCAAIRLDETGQARKPYPRNGSGWPNMTRFRSRRALALPPEMRPDTPFDVEAAAAPGHSCAPLSTWEGNRSRCLKCPRSRRLPLIRGSHTRASGLFPSNLRAVISTIATRCPLLQRDFITQDNASNSSLLLQRLFVAVLLLAFALSLVRRARALSQSSVFGALVSYWH